VIQVIKFNLNGMVRVKLTERGRQAMPGVAVDANGYSRHQLWYLMHHCGPHISLGAKPCWEGDIVLELGTV
jgi:hypothetical protein